MMVTQELDAYVASFEELDKTDRHNLIHPLRRVAMDRFLGMGFPTSRLEEWKFTSVAPIARHAFHPARLVGPGLQPTLEAPLADLGCPRLVFVNGHFSGELSSLESLPAGIHAGSLAQALHNGNTLALEHVARYARYEDRAFVALNTAFLRDGAFVHIPKGTILEQPIQLLFLSTSSGQPAVSYPRNLIVVGRESQATFVESYVGTPGPVYFTNAVTEIVAAENAVVEHYKIQQEDPQAFHIATIHVDQKRSSNFTSHSVSLGGALVRNDLYITLDGEGAEAILNGLYAVNGTQHVDHHTTIDHAQPHCSSREVYKGILDGKATAVFNGKIIVRKGAQKTDAKQTNKNLLLSENATINTTPQLEIYADDVKCTHGATIGQLGEELVFYLRSRGISLQEARALLTYAFANDITGRMKMRSIRSRLDELLLAWLKGAG